MGEPLTRASRGGGRDALVFRLPPAESPLATFARFRTLPKPTLLHSSDPSHPLGRYSYFAADPVSALQGWATEWPAHRSQLRRTLRERSTVTGLPPFQGGWMGWFTYELGTAFLPMPRVAADGEAVPDVGLALYDWVIAWDHSTGERWLISTGVDADGEADPRRAGDRAAEVLAQLEAPAPQPSQVIDSTDRAIPDMSAARYRERVADIVQRILAGEIFQANLTQRFTVPFAGDLVALADAVAARTGAPMGAVLEWGDLGVVSASPERFLRFDPASRMVESRPIKGTRPRVADPEQDALAAAELAASVKDRAENVMITDLLRNDLSKVSEPGSVTVPALCALETHPTVHHLVSTVQSRAREGCDALSILEAAFPGGSISGAPKLRAIEILAELEPVARGIYCGAIGWLGLDGALDTNLAIRTVVRRNGIATVHAGGGITARSDPESEYQESLVKLSALLAALGAVQ